MFLVSPKNYIIVVFELGPWSYTLRPTIEENVAAISYYYGDSSKDDYEQYEEECEW